MNKVRGMRMCDICDCDPCDFRCPEKKSELKGICDFCYDEIYDNESFDIDGIKIHKRCIDLYIKEALKKKYFDEYIEKNQFDFYYNFWFDFLNREEKLKIVKNSFLSLKKEERLKFIIDFCLQDFEDFKGFIVEGIGVENE